MSKAKRQHLNDYTRAVQDIERTQMVIDILERVTGAQRVIATLKKSQMKHLDRLDAAAAALGAPYPGKKVSA